jgi:hypothetical protein
MVQNVEDGLLFDSIYRNIRFLRRQPTVAICKFLIRQAM